MVDWDNWFPIFMMLTFLCVPIAFGWMIYETRQGQVQCQKACTNRGFVYDGWHEGYCECLKCNEYGICEDEVKIRR